VSTVIDVGGIKVSALDDGEVHLPPRYYPGLDFGAHPEFLQADGTYHIPVGCFLIQAGDLTVLVDAGLGPSSIPFPGDIAAAAGLTDPPESIAVGGLLPGALAASGVSPADITTVFLTHLHADHIGWVAPGGVLFFPNVVIMCSAVEWEAPPVAAAPGELEGRRGLAVARAVGVLRPVDAVSRGNCRARVWCWRHLYLATEGRVSAVQIDDALSPPCLSPWRAVPGVCWPGHDEQLARRVVSARPTPPSP
jgi:glyoxylase-like metal-dependent hydrolase (beta-lactamase superfamily II)